MEKLNNIASTQFNLLVATNNGPHRVNGKVSRGWGELIDGWSLRMIGDTRIGELNLHLGIDEYSLDFKDIYYNALKEDTADSLDFFMKVDRDTFPENKKPLSRTVERVGAKIILQHLQSLCGDNRSPFENPSLTRIYTKIAENHRHSLQANEFCHIQENYQRDLATID